MGQLTTQPYLAADAPEFLDYMGDLIWKTERMQHEGRVPQDANVRDFLDFWRTVVMRIRNDQRDPQNGPSETRTTHIPMSSSEYTAIWALLEPINSLIVILEARGAIKLTRTEGAMRVLKAVYRSSYE